MGVQIHVLINFYKNASHISTDILDESIAI